jgi:hypothetical protein
MNRMKKQPSQQVVHEYNDMNSRQVVQQRHGLNRKPSGSSGELDHQRHGMIQTGIFASARLAPQYNGRNQGDNSSSGELNRQRHGAIQTKNHLTATQARDIKEPLAPAQCGEPLAPGQCAKIKTNASLVAAAQLEDKTTCSLVADQLKKTKTGFLASGQMDKPVASTQENQVVQMKEPVGFMERFPPGRKKKKRKKTRQRRIEEPVARDREPPDEDD